MVEKKIAILGLKSRGKTEWNDAKATIQNFVLLLFYNFEFFFNNKKFHTYIVLHASFIRMAAIIYK